MTAEQEQEAFQTYVALLMQEGMLFGAAVVQARMDCYGVETKMGRAIDHAAILARKFYPHQPGLSPEDRRAAVERRAWRSRIR